MYFHFLLCPWPNINWSSLAYNVVPRPIQTSLNFSLPLVFFDLGFEALENEFAMNNMKICLTSDLFKVIVSEWFPLLPWVKEKRAVIYIHKSMTDYTPWKLAKHRVESRKSLAIWKEMIKRRVGNICCLSWNWVSWLSLPIFLEFICRSGFEILPWNEKAKCATGVSVF